METHKNKIIFYLKKDQNSIHCRITYVKIKLYENEQRYVLTKQVDQEEREIINGRAFECYFLYFLFYIYRCQIFTNPSLWSLMT